MCGIAGYVGKFSPKPENLQKTSIAMEHRGPDDKGFFSIIQTINTLH